MSCASQKHPICLTFLPFKGSDSRSSPAFFSLDLSFLLALKHTTLSWLSDRMPWPGKPTGSLRTAREGRVEESQVFLPFLLGLSANGKLCAIAKADHMESISSFSHP